MSIAADSLTALFQSRESSTLRVQTLLSLHVIGHADNRLLRSLLRHPDEHLRVWAIRLLTDAWPLDDPMGPTWRSQNLPQDFADQVGALLPALRELARTDESGLVRLALASTLQRLPVALRPSLAGPLVRRAEDADDHNLPLLIWYGLIPVADEDCGELVEVAKSSRLPTTTRLIARVLAEEIERHPSAINRLLRHAAEIAAAGADGESYAVAVLQGVSQGLKGWRRAPQPESWPRIASLKAEVLQPAIRELSVVFGDGRAVDQLKAIVSGGVETTDSIRWSALETLIRSDVEGLRSICESLLPDNRLNVLAARGLAKYDDPAIGQALVKRYRSFRAPFRPQIVSILVSRRAFAVSLLEAIRRGDIDAGQLSAFQVRQIHSFGDEDLSDLVREVWGEVREAPIEKQKAMSDLKERLDEPSLATADLGKGRALFRQLCQNCHRLYGDGATVGPDLTGSDRGNLDYLLSNIVDPSGVVDKNFRMTVLLTDDGRVINGFVTDETERMISLQTATEQLTLEADSIQSRKLTDKSPMPDGLLDNLTDRQVRDLIAYLKHPTQVPLPESTRGDGKP